MSSKIYRLVDCCLQWSSLVWRVPPWSPACHSRWAHCPGPAGTATNTCSQARTKKYLLNPTEGSPLRRLIIETIWNMLPTQYIYRPLYSYFKHLLNSWKRDGPDMWSFFVPGIWSDIEFSISPDRTFERISGWKFGWNSGIPGRLLNSAYGLVGYPLIVPGSRPEIRSIPNWTADPRKF